MNMKHLLITLLALLPMAARAQMTDPVSWTSDFKAEGDTATLTINATIEAGWHLYGTELPEIEFGPQATALTITSSNNLTPVGALTPSREPVQQYEDTFEAEVKFWEGSITLTQRFVITGSDPSVSGIIDYQACNDQSCIPPTSYEFTFGDAPEAAEAENAGKQKMPWLWLLGFPLVA